MAIESGEHQVLVQKWEEAERGMGTRPNGFSLHLSLDSLHKYAIEQLKKITDPALDEYSKPAGTSYVAGVSDAVVQQIAKTGDGLRFYSNAYPGDDSKDEWKPFKS